MTTVVSILMSDIVPLRERGTWQGIVNIIYATGAGYDNSVSSFFVALLIDQNKSSWLLFTHDLLYLEPYPVALLT